ncbi:MAG TPA: Rid family hydrolase [Nitrospirota bacterium]
MKTKFPATNLEYHISRTALGEAFITASVNSDASEAVEECYARLAATLAEEGLAIVHERLFGSLSFKEQAHAARKRALHASGIDGSGPLTYLEGGPLFGEGFAGVMIHAVPNEACVRELSGGGTVRGRSWTAGGNIFFMLQDLTGEAGEVIRLAESALKENGADFCDVIRTWFFLDDILSWYGEFNQIRNSLYGEFGIMPGGSESRLLLPASTGIEGTAVPGSRAALDLIAVTGQGGQSVRQMSNPGQMDAFKYNSAFSRGAVIECSGGKTVYISGTAAIDEQGVSLHSGDAKRQMECTFKKVRALLAQEGAGLNDIASATVFLKKPEYAPLFHEVLRELKLNGFPCVVMVADVCRDDLLFELDAVAVIKI